MLNPSREFYCCVVGVGVSVDFRARKFDSRVTLCIKTCFKKNCIAYSISSVAETGDRALSLVFQAAK